MVHFVHETLPYNVIAVSALNEMGLFHATLLLCSSTRSYVQTTLLDLDPLYVGGWYVGTSFCALLQLTDVQEGKAVRIDWLSDLKARIKVRHTTSDGKLMVHLGNEPLLYSRFMGGMFHPASPWVNSD